jgi:hypothetical protein
MNHQHENERPPHDKPQRRPNGWRRDLLFLAICGLTAVGLASALLPEVPSDQPLADTSRRRAAHRRQQTDAIVQAVDTSLHEDELPRALDADRLTVARRLWLSLMGTIPSLEEIRQLESGRVDTSAESSVDMTVGRPVADAEIDRMLDHVFADPRHADYLAERLARAYVGTEEGPFLLYRRRRFTAWLSDELLENRRYDAIVREMITARGLWTDQPAANFITVALVEDDDDDRLNESLLTSRMSRALLGVRLDCAECHDHPFADWTQRDYQGLAAFFAGTTPSLRGIRDDNTPYEVEDHESGEPLTITPAVPFAPELLPSEGGNRFRLARWLTSRDNKAFARATVNRVWAMMLGRPLVEPLDDIPVDDDVLPALDRLADSFAADGYDLRSLIRTIAHTEAFRQKSRTDSDEAVGGDWHMFPLTRLRPEQVVGALQQSAKVQTIDRESHILVKLARSIQQSEFIKRYGDAGGDELEPRVGTIPQRLVMMNGELVTEKSGDNPLGTVARIALLSPDDAAAIETAYLAVLTRRPTPPELEHFGRRLAETELSRARVLEDLYWSLVNSTEFSWNH